MRQVTAPARPEGPGRPAGRPVTGRWIWLVSGLATAGFLALCCAVLIARAGIPAGGDQISAVPTKTITITEPVSSVNVQSYGAGIQVTTGSGPDVTVTEAIRFASGDGSPAVTAAVSGGLLTLAAPACAESDCSVGFTVTLPSPVPVTAASGGGDIIVSGAAAASLDSGGGGVRAENVTGSLGITSGGGPVIVSGTAGANIDSGSGPVQASGIHGPLNVSTEGGPLGVTGLTGQLHADTGGGSLAAEGISATAATVITSGGEARLNFVTAPDSLQVSTGGGAADVSVPGGPYALTADSGGGPEVVSIATNAAATRAINVSTDGGPLRIGAGPAGGKAVSDPGAAGKQPVPPKPPAPPKPPVPQVQPKP